MIVAFTKDWDDVPTCTTHILREMGKTMPVLWVSSIGTRKPSAASGKDLRRIIGRILSGLKRAEWKENNLRVLKPILIPKAEAEWAKWVNRKVFAWYVRREQRGVESGKWKVESGTNAGPQITDRRPQTGGARATCNVQPETIEYWCFVPNAVDLLPGVKQKAEMGKLKWRDREERGRSELGVRSSAYGIQKPGARNPEPGTKVIYYCADDWGQFHNLDGAWMDAKERELVDRADVVFVTSRFLEKKLEFEQEDAEGAEVGSRRSEVGSQRSEVGSLKSEVGGLKSARDAHTGENSRISDLGSPTSDLGSRTSDLRSPIHYLPHGVEHERFSQALDKTLPVPGDVAGLPKPIIGFYGNLHPWVDFGIVAALAVARPEWSFVLIGERYADVAALEALSNVHLLGRREHGCLHDYCRAFDVAIIPYDMTNPRMESVNPVKTKELLAAGLPVVASDVPELRNYGDDVLTCTGEEAWLLALDRQVARDDHVAISERVREESWENKVAVIRAIVES
jgi:glycosyltransferase involved in cell wall biosynthesis